MTGRKPTTLGYALLGLINQRPQSGYDLHRLFVTTPIGRFSGSPGAVYPALARLEERGLISGRVAESCGARTRVVYRLTRTGRSVLRSWFRESITQEDVEKRSDVLMLRFAYMEQLLEPDECVDFLSRFERMLMLHISAIKQFSHEHEDSMPLHGRLAIQSGIMGYETMVRWSRIARKELQEAMA